MSTTNPFSVEGKTAILTGSAGYFGRKFAEVLLANGSKVFLFDKDEKNIDLANSLSSRFGSENIEYFQVDFYDEEAYRESLTQVAEKKKHNKNKNSRYKRNKRHSLFWNGKYVKCIYSNIYKSRNRNVEQPQ